MACNIFYEHPSWLQRDSKTFAPFCLLHFPSIVFKYLLINTTLKDPNDFGKFYPIRMLTHPPSEKGKFSILDFLYLPFHLHCNRLCTTKQHLFIDRNILDKFLLFRKIYLHVLSPCCCWILMFITKEFLHVFLLTSLFSLHVAKKELIMWHVEIFFLSFQFFCAAFKEWCMRKWSTPAVCRMKLQLNAAKVSLWKLYPFRLESFVMTSIAWKGIP